MAGFQLSRRLIAISGSNLQCDSKKGSDAARFVVPTLWACIDGHCEYGKYVRIGRWEAHLVSRPETASLRCVGIVLRDTVGFHHLSASSDGEIRRVGQSRKHWNGMEWHPKTPIERGLYPSFQLDVRTRTCTEVENRSRTSSSVEARGGLAELAKLVILWELESFTNGGLQTSVVLQPCTWLSVSVASFILYCLVFQPTHHFQL